MSLAIQLLLNGLAFAGLIFLLAAGLSVVFGLMDVLNLAHGSFYMLGAYAGLTVLELTRSFWWALVLVPLTLAVIGVAVELTFFRRLYRRGHLPQVLLTFGLALVFVDLVRLRYGPANQPFPTPAELAFSINVLGVDFSAYRAFVILVAGILAGLLLLGWRRLKIGALLRAGVADREMVGLLGININTIFTLTFGCGAALAGLAGVIAGPYLSVYPGMDENVLILALVVVVIGGLGSIEGAILGSLVMGLASSFGTFFVHQLAVAIVFAVMAVVLLARPRGLIGRAQ